MNSEIRVWSVDMSNYDAKELESIQSLESEHVLEELFVNNPQMLMPGLTLVARQARAGKARVEDGELDLLGIDEYGGLVVFELKKKSLARQAVAQTIDYCSYLESLTERELLDYISKYSSQLKTASSIDDFEAWYIERGWELENDLKPIKMVLVAFDADDAAFRMVDFLSERGVAISIQTFQGFHHHKQTLLASQLDRAIEEQVGRKSRKLSRVELYRALAHQASELGISEFWEDVKESLSISSSRYPTLSGVTFSQPKIKFFENKWNSGSSHSIIMENERIKIIFFPAAVHLCEREFNKKKEEILFRFEKPTNAEKTNKISDQWYCLLNQDEWILHKESLMNLTNHVNDAWRNYRKETGEPES